MADNTGSSKEGLLSLSRSVRVSLESLELLLGDSLLRPPLIMLKSPQPNEPVPQPNEPVPQEPANPLEEASKNLQQAMVIAKRICKLVQTELISKL